MIRSGEHTNRELLLTSAGFTNEAIQERMLEIARSRGPLASLKIVRVADGWNHFNRNDGVTKLQRIEQHIAAAAAKSWSYKYVAHVLGKAEVVTRTVQSLNPLEMEALLERTDILLVPGGNTFITMWGMQPHAERIRNAVNGGMPYIGESAGTIIAGRTTLPGSLEPPDTKPRNAGTMIEKGLGLINADIVVHASRDGGHFDIPGIKSWIAAKVLASYATPSAVINGFADQQIAENHPPIYVLNDMQALSVSGDTISLIA